MSKILIPLVLSCFFFAANADAAPWRSGPPGGGSSATFGSSGDSDSSWFPPLSLPRGQQTNSFYTGSVFIGLMVEVFLHQGPGNGNGPNPNSIFGRVIAWIHAGFQVPPTDPGGGKPSPS